MERRIKLSNEDLKIIADSLDATHILASNEKFAIEDEGGEATEQDAFIERVEVLRDEFRSRIDPDDED